IGDRAPVAALQNRAIELYKTVLAGENGLFAPLQGQLRSKVEFQLARLYMDQGRTAEASPIFERLSALDELREIARESSLRLAELKEKGNAPSELARAQELYSRAIQLCGES